MARHFPRLVKLGVAAAVVLAFATPAAPPARADVAAGWAAYLSGDYGTAVAELEPAAEAGDAEAQFYMGTLRAHGAGLPRDYGASLEWYRRAAEQGHAGAQFAIGLLYHDGAGGGAIPRDPAEAAIWLTRAAEGGNAMAQHLLGRMYRRGSGVPKDQAQAVKWSLAAARRGVPFWR